MEIQLYYNELKKCHRDSHGHDKRLISQSLFKTSY